MCGVAQTPAPACRPIHMARGSHPPLYCGYRPLISRKYASMSLTYIWSGFFVVGLLAALLQFFFMGDTEIFKRIVDGTFTSAKSSVMDIALPLAGVMTLWLGIMNIGERPARSTCWRRLLRRSSRASSPACRRITRPTATW